MDFLYKKVGNYQYDPNTTLIGKGTFGEVFMGEHIEDPNNKVAIKFISATTLEAHRENLKMFIREVEVLKGIKGKHLLELKEATQTASGNLYLITNYCNGGNLEMLLFKEKTIKAEVALKYLRQIAEAFEELANLDITNTLGRKMTLMHRDIKPSNILLHDGEIVIADFGFAKFAIEIEKGIKRDHTKLGTPSYMAPQLLARADYSYKCDVWSTGVVIYELIFGKKPWEGASQLKLLDNMRNEPLKFPKAIPSDFEDLLSKMLTYDDRDRISWKQILVHPAFELEKKVGTQIKPEIVGTQIKPEMVGRIQIISQGSIAKEMDSKQEQSAQNDQTKAERLPNQAVDNKPVKKSKIRIIE